MSITTPASNVTAPTQFVQTKTETYAYRFWQWYGPAVATAAALHLHNPARNIDETIKELSLHDYPEPIAVTSGWN